MEVTQYMERCTGRGKSTKIVSIWRYQTGKHHISSSQLFFIGTIYIYHVLTIHVSNRCIGHAPIPKACIADASTVKQPRRANENRLTSLFAFLPSVSLRQALHQSRLASGVGNLSQQLSSLHRLPFRSQPTFAQRKSNSIRHA